MFWRVFQIQYSYFQNDIGGPVLNGQQLIGVISKYALVIEYRAFTPFGTELIKEFMENNLPKETLPNTVHARAGSSQTGNSRQIDENSSNAVGTSWLENTSFPFVGLVKTLLKYAYKHPGISLEK